VKKPFQPAVSTGLKALEAALALEALESPKLPIAVLPQDLLSPAKKASSSCLGINQSSFIKLLQAIYRS